MRPFSSPPRERDSHGWNSLSPSARIRPNYHTHILLFLMTVVTTVVAGMIWEGLNPIEHLRQFYRGFPYAGTLLAILFFHEMGHYLTARYFGMDVTWPYFIPMPPPLFMIGTMGAFIRMKSPPHHRRALLYIAAAGPIAGFCVALPAVIYAYATSTVMPIPVADGRLYYEFGEPLLLQIVGRLLVGPIPEGYALQINSVGIAAWFGLLVTMLNLLPVGQLDGGHIVYALLGRQARYISWGVIGALLVMGVFFHPLWFVWAVIGYVLIRLRQPVLLDYHSPLSRRSQAIAGIALVIFVLCFMPVPISIGNLSG